MLVLLGKYIWGFEFSKNDPFYLNDGTATQKCKLYTIIFETFVFMQIFNEFNCKCISPKKLNMFSNLFSNWLFLAVIVVTSLLTVFFVQYTGQMMRVTSLDATEHAACLMWGSTVLVVSVLLKLTPATWA
jgi:magnesium-transporting ATPase (P-type)